MTLNNALSFQQTVYFAALTIALAFAGAACTEQPQADPSNPERVAVGKRVYGEHVRPAMGQVSRGSRIGASVSRAANSQRRRTMPAATRGITPMHCCSTS